MVPAKKINFSIFLNFGFYQFAPFTPIDFVHLEISPFLTKRILLAMCLVCLIPLPFLAMHIADLLKINILKCAKAIPAVHAALYSLFALD